MFVAGAEDHCTCVLLGVQPKIIILTSDRREQPWSGLREGALLYSDWIQILWHKAETLRRAEASVQEFQGKGDLSKIKNLVINIHRDVALLWLTQDIKFPLTTPRPMVITCPVNDKANNIVCLGSLIQKEEAQRVKGPGDLLHLIFQVVTGSEVVGQVITKVRVMLMLVIFYRFNIPPQVWNAYALSDVTHRKNYKSQVISNTS